MKTDLERYIENMTEIHREALQSNSTDAAGLDQMAMFAIETAKLFRKKMRDKDRELFFDAIMEGCSFDNTHALTVRSVVEQIYDSGRFKLVKNGE